MAKAGGPNKAKPRHKMTDKEQSERFKETARELGVDENGSLFEKVFEKIIRPQRGQKLIANE
jgi:hypothetical protein